MSERTIMRFSILIIVLVGAVVVWVTSPSANRQLFTSGGQEPSRSMPELRLNFDPVAGASDGRVQSYADMLEGVTPTVVGVHTARLVQHRSQRMDPMEELFRRHFGWPHRERERPAEPEEGERMVPHGMGSGVIISADGYILTNHHVISYACSQRIADEIRVTLATGEELDAEVVGSDPQTDVAVLKVEVDRPLPVITFADSDQIRVGDLAFAIGNPLGVGLTVTQGIVSAVGRTDLGILGRGTYENFIQTDASINVGNSGGPLVDAEGRLIGINTAIMSRTGGNIGIGFAIPSNLARHILSNLVESGTVARGFLGVYLTDIDRDLAESFGYDSTRGALIQQVQSESAADRAGIEHGDIIFALNGRDIQSASELRLLISQTRPGTAITLGVFRGGERIEIEVVLGSLDGEVARADEPRTVDIIPGVELAGLTEELRQRFSVPSEVEGVVVTEVTRSTRFNEAFRPGVVIIEVNGVAVSSSSEVRSRLSAGVNRVYLWFDGSKRFIAYRHQEE